MEGIPLSDWLAMIPNDMLVSLNVFTAKSSRKLVSTNQRRRNPSVVSFSRINTGDQGDKRLRYLSLGLYNLRDGILVSTFWVFVVHPPSFSKR